MNVTDVAALGSRIRTELAKAVVGQTDTVELLLTALLSQGHILLEGPPGLAKTFVAQCFARTLELGFGRIQFTPDLMPGDVLGSNIFHFQTGVFTLRRGPIFCDLLLADEINRTPPKTQAALLEAMQERRVTLDGKPEALSPHFMVVATQNPIEQQGVYPLPEAQLDRFLFKHVLGYPSVAEEQQIVENFGTRSGQPDAEAMGIDRVAGIEELNAAMAAVRAVRLGPEVAAYVVALVRATRESPDIQAGASPRAGVHLAIAARARAALEGRDYTVPDDVKALILPCLRHRILLWPAAEIEGRGADEVLNALVAAIKRAGVLVSLALVSSVVSILRGARPGKSTSNSASARPLGMASSSGASIANCAAPRRGASKPSNPINPHSAATQTGPAIQNPGASNASSSATGAPAATNSTARRVG